MVYQDQAEKNIINALRGGHKMTTIELHKISGLSEPRFTASTIQALTHEGLLLMTRVEGKETYHLASGLGHDDSQDSMAPQATANAVPSIPVPPPTPVVKPAPVAEPVKPPMANVAPEQRASHHVGIYPSSSKARPYRATANLYGKTHNLGTFEDEQSAVEARKQFLANPPAPPPGKKAMPPKPAPPASPAVAEEAAEDFEPRPEAVSPLKEMVSSIVDKLIREELERRLR